MHSLGFIVLVLLQCKKKLDYWSTFYKKTFQFFYFKMIYYVTCHL